MDLVTISTISLIILILSAGVIVGITKLAKLSLKQLSLSILGLIVGLSVGALLAVPTGKLPAPYGNILPLAITILITLASISLFVYQSHRIGKISLGHLLSQARPKIDPVEISHILVDTSVIIDGRIADIAAAGFVRGSLVVPRFVLAELQNIADSDDPMRRSRGRRGLDVLNILRTTQGVKVEVSDEDIPDVKEVDAKLVGLARSLGADILTTDYNLNRVAEFEGVRVLNVNELANAIRPVVLPGEDMKVKIVQAGKERNQGVGYLADGTMIVVENGDKLMGQEVPIEVTRVFQTVAGKMIFASPKNLQQPIANTTKHPKYPKKPPHLGDRAKG